jgi:hypothetical protein
LKASKQESGAGKYRDRERDLCADQSPLNAVASRDLRAAGLRQRIAGIAARAANCRNDSTQEGYQDCGRQRVKHDSNVQRYLIGPRKRRGERAKGARRRDGQRKAESCS